METEAIRKMAPEDLDQVLTIERSSSLDPWSRGAFSAEMSHPFSHCFILERNEDRSRWVTAFLCFRIIEDESEILNICVHPKVRRMGIGKKLMRFYLHFCGQKKIKKFYLEVNSSNQPAIQFYNFFSYRPIGKRPRFYQGKFNALLMSKET